MEGQTTSQLLDPSRPRQTTVSIAMRYFFAFAVLAATLSNQALLRADESLFSQVAMESVFAESAPSTENVASKVTSNRFNRITGLSMLTEALKTAELSPTKSKDRVKVEMPHEGWKFPVSMAVDVDQDRISLEMSLIVMDDSGQATNTLLDLLALGDPIDGAFFAFDRSKKLIQVRSSLSNRSVTTASLKAELLKLAVFAEKHSDVWMKLKSTSTTAKSKPAVTPSKPIRSTAPKLTLLGRWSASLSSGESFAIQMTADSKFQLVHLKSGKATISKGKATRTGNRLTLAGSDSVTLQCRVSQSVANKFRLTILDSKGKDAVSLDFKKAK